MAEKKEVYESTAYVLGIMSIVFAFVSPIAGLIFGIIGIVQSNKFKSQISERARRFSIIGIILSIIIAIFLVIVTSIGILNSLNIPRA